VPWHLKKQGLKEGKEQQALYIGESYKTLFRRSHDHFEAYKKKAEKSWCGNTLGRNIRELWEEKEGITSNLKWHKNTRNLHYGLQMSSQVVKRRERTQRVNERNRKIVYIKRKGQIL
jgi:hypothetical protein